MAFRTTPILGPDVNQTETGYYWDDIAPDVTEPSYQLGTRVMASDGYEYIHVKNAGVALAVGDELEVDMDTFVATKSAGGGFTAQVAVAPNAFFHARVDFP